MEAIYTLFCLLETFIRCDLEGILDCHGLNNSTAIYQQIMCDRSAVQGRDSQEKKFLEKNLEKILQFKKFFKKSFLVLVNQDSNLSTRNAPFSQYAQEIFQEIEELGHVSE